MIRELKKVDDHISLFEMKSNALEAVSYTHLDVYKRQLHRSTLSLRISSPPLAVCFLCCVFFRDVLRFCQIVSLFTIAKNRREFSAVFSQHLIFVSLNSLSHSVLALLCILFKLLHTLT